MRLVLSIVGLGLLASVSPSTLVVFILLLATDRARANAAAFLVGWMLSLTVVFGASYLVGGSLASGTAGGSTAVEVVELMLGAALVAVGVRQWGRRHEPRPERGTSQRLAARLERLHPTAALVLGVLEQPWTLTAAAAVVVVRHHEAFPVVLLAFALFTAASTASVGALYLYFYRRPGQAAAHLDALRQRLEAAGPTLFAVVSALVGLFLVVDGALGLAGH